MLFSRWIAVVVGTSVASFLLIVGVVRMLPPRPPVEPNAPVETTAPPSLPGQEPGASHVVLHHVPACPKEDEDLFFDTAPVEKHLPPLQPPSVTALLPPPPPVIEIPRVEMPLRAALPELPDLGPRPRPLRPEAIRLPRAQKLDEPALVRELEKIPEISLYTTFTQAQAQRAMSEGTLARQPTEPPPLLEQEGLNPLRGEACKLSEPDAKHLQEKSLQLRELLTRPRVSFSSLRTTDDPFGSTEALSTALFRHASQQWLANESVPVLVQMLMAENTQRRKVLIEALAKIPSPRASVALAQRACFDLDPERRLQAVQALATRPSEEYVGVLMAALRYPWQPINFHAAEALAALQRKEVIPGLLQMLDQPDPVAPYSKPGKKGEYVRELVRINHFRGCLLCHPPSFDPVDLVRGNVPTTDTPIPSGPLYYAPQSLMVTARVTYLRQDFSLPQIVSNPGKWPEQQRFDFLTRERPLRAEERPRLEGKITRSNEPAIVHALRFLTKQDVGSTADDWKRHFLHRDVAAELRLQGLKDSRAVVVDEVGTALIAERDRILRLPREGEVSEWYYPVAPIRDLALDRRGAVWLALEHGPLLHRVELQTQVRTRPGDPRRPLHEPSRLASDKHRGIYIVQGDGKVKYQNAANVLASVPLGTLRVEDVALNAEGDHLYLAVGKEIWRARVSDAGLVEAPQRLWSIDRPLTRLAVDEREVLVVGTAEGVSYYSPEGLKLGQTPLPEPVVALALRASHAHVLTTTRLYRIELAAISRP